jgi:pyruvate dehydrogenase E1 component beta subunit
MAVTTYKDAIRQAMWEEMASDSTIFIMGEDIGKYGGTFKITEGFLEEFGEDRVIDTPISEAGFSGISMGAALVGLRPIVEMMTINFSMVAIDQIVNHIAKWRYMSGGQFAVPVVIRGPGGPGGQLGAQHSQSLESWFAHVPGLKVVMPSTPADAKGLMRSAIRDDDPVIFIEHAGLYNTRGEVPEGDHFTPIGKANVTRPGRDITIVAYSRMAAQALIAAEMLAKEGIEAEVIDLRTLSPLDIDPVIASVKKTNRAVVCQEEWKFVGIAAEVASQIYEQAFDYLDAPVERIGGADVPMPYARNLEALAVPGHDTIVDAARRATGRVAQ